MSVKLSNAKTNAEAFIVRFEESLPPICMLSSHYTLATPVLGPPPAPSRIRTPKAHQFPKSVIPALKHEARPYYSLISTQREEQRKNYLRYPRLRKPLGAAIRDLDAFYVSNGHVKRKENPMRPVTKDSDDTEIVPYRSKVKSKPDLTGLREMMKENAEMRHTLLVLNKELMDFASKSYLMTKGKSNSSLEALRSGSVSPQPESSGWILKSSFRKSN